MIETEEKVLSFCLGNQDTAVIPLANITEVFQVSLNDVCGVPEMPNCIQGIYNWRGEMLWLIDLELMLGYASLSYRSNITAKMMVIVIQYEGKYLGLLVRQLMDIERLNSGAIKLANSQLFPHEVLPFLRGYFINESEKMIIAINPESIFNAPYWQIHN
ncbi:chemotaxis protein CheW [Calothrix sp. NIES-3974]|uniref:chemotaxis protein CheW n=1 Tax=Calothrix sp. NIES-3974 TaxID=2005462 RepID=UPI000B5EE803|nr:chemotaxis protein CheW [Calothrix sp. NIES-3974]BAZ07347.1 CheW protein [Calothrix sp. NIES-3974]